LGDKDADTEIEANNQAKEWVRKWLARVGDESP